MTTLRVLRLPRTTSLPWRVKMTMKRAAARKRILQWSQRKRVKARRQLSSESSENVRSKKKNPAMVTKKKGESEKAAVQRELRERTKSKKKDKRDKDDDDDEEDESDEDEEEQETKEEEVKDESDEDEEEQETKE